jgi:ABC-type glycerol-3-phosphate transport system substrate-binding protein
MKNMSKFQLIFTGIFAAFIIIGLILFALTKLGTTGQSNVAIWGTISENQFTDFIKNTSLYNSKTINIKYSQKDKNSFDENLVQALAVGKGPDIFFLSSKSILKNKDKIFIIPFANYSESLFNVTFIQEGKLYLDKTGVIAVPFMVDPLVMYWNRDILGSAGLSQPPKHWSDLYDLVPGLTKKDNSLNIAQSAIALGEYDNISNANEILSSLLLQSGNSIISNNINGSLAVNLKDTANVFDFYSSFSNQLKPYYSWNKSLPVSKDFFTSNNLALYIGLASDYKDISSKNPNLNFDVTYLPQSDNSNSFTTYGDMQALAISKASKNLSASLQVINALTEPNSILALSQMTDLPPVRNDLLSQSPSGTFMPVFYKSAINSRGWLEPDETKVDGIFSSAVDSFNNGIKSDLEGVLTNKLRLLLQNYVAQ